MLRADGRLIYSASDLNNYLECDFLTALDLEAVDGHVERPPKDEQTALIARKGDEHERLHLADLKKRYGVVELPGEAGGAVAELQAAEARTVEAMESGARIIYQGAFFDSGAEGDWQGRSDFLERVESPSARWAWSYEVVDTKLALHTKPYFIIQLCFYSEQLQRIQGTAPGRMHVVLGNGERKSFRVADYSAYYRHLKRTFLHEAAQMQQRNPAHNGAVPLPVAHCAICSWNPLCEQKRDAADHLSLVAWLRNDQIKKFAAVSPPIDTMTKLAGATDAQRPPRMGADTYASLRRQAALQVHFRTHHTHKYELLQSQERLGFGLLPEPAEGDVFFDMEGDPLYQPDRGLEYLFGAYLPGGDEFKPFWGRTPRDEKRAFERFVDFVVERQRRYPKLHVYHYASYEKNALRKLSLRHTTRVDEVDDLLRGETLVDLYAVVRQTLRISQDGYSIKKLEPFYGFVRKAGVRKGDQSIVMFEQWLESADNAILESIERYNEEDCRSTYELLKWLVQRREEAMRSFGVTIPWRPTRSAADVEANGPAAGTDERDRTRERLLDGLPEIETQRQLDEMNDDQRARWLLGHLLAYHKREDKPAWWKLFDNCEKSDDELREDRECIGGLALCTDVAPERVTSKSQVYTYRFPEQEHNLSENPVDPRTRKSAGTIVEIEDQANRLKIKRSDNSQAEFGDITALIPSGPIDSKTQQKSLLRIAQTYLAGKIETSHPAIVDILLRRPPRLTTRHQTLQPSTPNAEHILPIVQSLDASYLFIQGPPGSGKSTTASTIIVALLKQGKRVAIMSNTHKAIHNLLHKVEATAREQGVRFRGLQRHSGGETEYKPELSASMIEATDDNRPFESKDYQLAAGTSWLFARDELSFAFDYLFIDEAGQTALANAIAVAPCARNVVLLGDPLQLAQVSQGTHPVGSGNSVLQHLLGDQPTIPEDRGIFLDVSYRMHPAICGFISDAVYAGRLKADPKNERQHITSPGLSGSGTRFIGIEHEGNSRESNEEAQRIVDEIELLKRGTVQLKKGPERPITDGDILVVSPYNAQRKLIRRLLDAAGIAVRVGTVDKFQGQQAPVVFYSMATSSDEDIPRDINFLFEKNRLNVAVSRAQCLSAIVASPRLLEVRCKTADQIAMVNVLCRYVETAAPATALTA